LKSFADGREGAKDGTNTGKLVLDKENFVIVLVMKVEMNIK
jgi:hypothetical protein